MAVIHSNDAALRQLIFDHTHVIVKYHTSACPICEMLVPVYDKLSEKKEYKKITFVRMNALENPVAKLFVTKQTIPFIAIYKKGLLLECRTVETEKQLVKMLDKIKPAKVK